MQSWVEPRRKASTARRGPFLRCARCSILLRLARWSRRPAGKSQHRSLRFVAPRDAPAGDGLPARIQ